jgi:uncharacterized protein YggE
MVKEMNERPQRGFMLVLAAVLIAAGMLGGSYMLAQVDYSPKVNVSDITSTPNVYVSSNPPEHMISVSGTASKKVSPDLLVITLRVQTESKNAKDSQERNAVVMDELMDELETLGVPDNEIQTSSYRVEVVRRSVQKCDTKGCYYESVVTGYRTVHGLTLSLTQLDSGGEILDEVTGVGTNETFVDYIDFTLKPETRRTLEKELLEDAAAEAQDRADEIAGGLGVTLGKPLTASESVYYPTYYRSTGYDMAYAAEAGAPSTELSGGEIETSATVSVGFEIA